LGGVLPIAAQHPCCVHVGAMKMILLLLVVGWLT
jgi:hypothetical protein